MSVQDNEILATGGPNELSNIDFNKTNEYAIYYQHSRYIPFVKCCETIKKYGNIKTCLDIACSSGHFVYVANENNIDTEGFDIIFDENINNIFVEKFKKKCIFKFNLNNIIDLSKKYDIITNFHLTHVFDNNAFIYLLGCLSNKCSYAYLHISNENIISLKKTPPPFIDIIEIIDLYHPNTLNNTTSWIFLKFTKAITTPRREFIRPASMIILKK